MYTIFVLNKEYVEQKELSEKIQLVASELDLGFEEYQAEYLLFNVYEYGGGDLLEIYPNDKEGFMSDVTQNLFKQSYGSVIIINYNNGGDEQNKTLIPFLKQFLHLYPEMIVYNEEQSRLNGASIFTKKTIDDLKSNDILAGLFNSSGDNNIT